jgi:uncharacterized protein DUF6941
MSEDQKVNRPYLQMAVFCEKVLREADGVLSVIRVIDRLVHTGAEKDMLPFTHQFIACLTFKSGQVNNKMTIRLKPISPDGRPLQEMSFPVLFEGDDRGASVVVQLNFTFELEGLYWFDVFVEHELVTRMSIRILYQQTATSLPWVPQS